MPCLSLRDGRLFVEDCQAAGLAERFGTPLYVVSETQLRANLRAFRRAFEASWTEGPVHVLPSIKANYALALRRILSEEGAGCDTFGAQRAARGPGLRRRPGADLGQRHRQGRGIAARGRARRRARDGRQRARARAAAGGRARAPLARDRPPARQATLHRPRRRERLLPRPAGADPRGGAALQARHPARRSAGARPRAADRPRARRERRALPRRPSQPASRALRGHGREPRRAARRAARRLGRLAAARARPRRRLLVSRETPWG